MNYKKIFDMGYGAYQGLIFWILCVLGIVNYIESGNALFFIQIALAPLVSIMFLVLAYYSITRKADC